VSAPRESYLKLIESQGRINGRFINIRRIDSNGGDGFFSLVFTAYDEVTKQEVVLKFYNPLKSADRDRVERFHREGDILKLLKGQENILECLDGVCILPIEFDSHGITVTHNYEFIPTKKANANIEQLIYRDSLSPLLGLLYFKEMCKAVARIHSKKICHRDLKPNNFFLFPKNDLRLGDFGTAKYLDGSMPDIRANYTMFVGHRDYIAPELICQIGLADVHSYAADVFALGAILFEIFSKQVLTQHIFTPDVLSRLLSLQSTMHLAKPRDRLDIYIGVIDTIESSVNIPNIYDFNSFVPNSIKVFLNLLYKDLTLFNFSKRLMDFQAIHRRIDICVLILRNEDKYRRWLRRTR